MADPTTEPEPKPEPTVTPAPTEGALAAELADLKQLLTDLPGKIVATVTDDDKRSLAESVYDLFDSGGAFDKPTEKPEVTPATTPEAKPEPTPKKRGKLSGFASWFAGEQ